MRVSELEFIVKKRSKKPVYNGASDPTSALNSAGIAECRCVTENGADGGRINDLQKTLTDNFLRKMAEIRAFKLNVSDTSDSE